MKGVFKAIGTCSLGASLLWVLPSVASAQMEANIEMREAVYQPVRFKPHQQPGPKTGPGVRL